MTDWTEHRTALDYGAGILKGTKTYLRELRDDDLPALVSWMIDPTVAVFQAFVVRPQPFDAIAEQFRSWSANKDSTGAGFSIVARETDELIGHVALWDASVAARAATLAIVIGPDRWGAGVRHRRPAGDGPVRLRGDGPQPGSASARGPTTPGRWPSTARSDSWTKAGGANSSSMPDASMTRS